MLELIQMGAEYYLAIDMGATKTLLAVFEPSGKLVLKRKLVTDPDYAKLKAELASAIGQLNEQYRFSYCAAAVPATVDLDNGVAMAFGNETWTKIPIEADLKSLLPAAKVLVHNDAKLAALSEAVLFHNKYKKLLYLTISTGIGGGVITNGVIDPGFENFEPGQMIFEHDGRQGQWEDFASGRALKAKYGKLASEIDDPAIWQAFAKLLTPGIENLLATVKPDVIVFGGGVGAHFEKFQSYLEAELKKINNPLVPVPALLKAQRPEEAVIYGCYDYIKQNL